MNEERENRKGGKGSPRLWNENPQGRNKVHKPRLPFHKGETKVQKEEAQKVGEKERRRGASFVT